MGLATGHWSGQSGAIMPIVKDLKVQMVAELCSDKVIPCQAGLSSKVFLQINILHNTKFFVAD